MNPINGLEIANQSEAASRRRQAPCCVVFTVYDFPDIESGDRSILVWRGESEQLSKA